MDVQEPNTGYGRSLFPFRIRVQRQSQIRHKGSRECRPKGKPERLQGSGRKMAVPMGVAMINTLVVV